MAEIVRSGFVEGHHYGSVVALDAAGEVDWSVGMVDEAVLPRSCNKPIQALAMVRAGLSLPPELLALACASHSGEPFHVEGVRRILAGAGLAESDLQTPPDYPLDDAAREDVIRGGGGKTSIQMNCSGKHAAMLATCVLNGWSTEDYLDPAHPLQVAIAETFAELTGEPVDGSPRIGIEELADVLGHGAVDGDPVEDRRSVDPGLGVAVVAAAVGGDAEVGDGADYEAVWRRVDYAVGGDAEDGY